MPRNNKQPSRTSDIVMFCLFIVTFLASAGGIATALVYKTQEPKGHSNPFAKICTFRQSHSSRHQFQQAAP